MPGHEDLHLLEKRLLLSKLDDSEGSPIARLQIVPCFETPIGVFKSGDLVFDGHQRTSTVQIHYSPQIPICQGPRQTLL